MTRVLGIDTSNYTTSIAVVEDGKCILDLRKLLSTKQGKRGLRQSEALFQHILNVPELLEQSEFSDFDGVSVSTKPRPAQDSYMPVFKGGESIARSISSTSNINLISTTHQEGHIEAACNSINFNYNEFLCMHLSGGTTEILKVNKAEGYNYNIEIIGKTLDISAGQFIDRIGVAMGLAFPCGVELDKLATSIRASKLIIPICVKNFDVNFSGQETKGLKYMKDGYNHKELSFAVMNCVARTLEKVIKNLFLNYNLPLLITGGVAGSNYIKLYLLDKFKSNVFFSDMKYASDNAVGVAYIGYNILRRL